VAAPAAASRVPALAHRVWLHAACFLLGITLIVVGRIPGTKGFVVLPRRWAEQPKVPRALRVEWLWRALKEPSAGSATGGVCPRIMSGTVNLSLME